MDTDNLKGLLENVKSGEVTVSDAVNKLKKLPYEDLGFAKVDHHRELRNGYPEVIYCEGKTVEQINGIFEKLISNSKKNLMGTRLSKEKFIELKKSIKELEYYEDARICVLRRNTVKLINKTITIISAGTSDMAVAEEAAITAEILGNKTNRIYDVGVAGIHRLFDKLDEILDANVIIVVAGMEGALVSVVGGLVDKPVIAVPTSVGYGASFNGIAPLLTMLNSCSSGIGVVNIDNGFGAGYLASTINKL